MTRRRWWLVGILALLVVVRVALPEVIRRQAETRVSELLKARVQIGDVMVIDHADLDRVAAETIVEAQPGAVINASPSITGRYPNLGPLLVCAAGIPLIDGVGPEVMDAIAEVGVERILFSVDYPFEDTVDGTSWFDAAEISEADRRAIGRDNARRLFGL